MVLEGPAGIGKTALLTVTCDEARKAGMATLTARAGELETGLPWGVVRGLFEPELDRASRAERQDLLSGTAGLAHIALRSDGGQTAPRRADALGAALHGLCERLTREQGAPAVLLVSGNGAADGAVGKACGARDLISKAELAHVDLRSIWA